MSHSRRKQWIASKWGRGYHRSGPTGWLPDRSGLLKIDEERSHCKIAFSMARTPAIADIALTGSATLGLNPMLRT